MLQIFLFVIISGIAMTVLGMLFSKKNTIDLKESYINGFLLSLCIFQIFVLPAIVFKMMLSTLMVCYFMIIFLLVIISWIRNRREIYYLFHNITFTVPNIWMTIAYILIALQTAFLAFGLHIDDDDAFYVAQSVTSLDTNSVFRYDPYSGVAFTKLPARYVLSPYPIYGSVLSAISQIRPVILFHTVLPILLIPMAYMVYKKIGDLLLDYDKKSVGLFLSFISLLNIFAGSSVRTQGTFLLVRIWQGKAILAGVLLPYMLWFVLMHFKKQVLSLREWILLFCIVFASCAVSSMGIILSAIMLGSFAVVFFRYDKKNRPYLLLQSMICCIPNVIFALVYILIL